MKICILGNASNQGFFTHMWFEHFSKNHDVTVASFHKPDTCYDNVVYVPHTQMSFLKPLSFYRVIKQIRRQLQTIKPDVLISLYVTHYGYIGDLSGVVPHVLVPLGSDIAVDPYTSHLKRHCVKMSLVNANLVLVQDSLSEQQVRHLGGRHIQIIPWGVVIQKPKQVKKQFDVINLNGYSFDKHRIETYLKAVKLLKQVRPMISCLLVGADLKSRQLAHQLDILDVLKMTDVIPHDETMKLLQQSRVFVETFKPNHNRGGHTYGMSVIEAMASEIPTVVSDRQTVIQHPDEWYHGMVFDGTPQHLADNVLSLLDNKELYHTVMEENRKEAVSRFDIKKNMQRIEEVICDLCT